MRATFTACALAICVVAVAEVKLKIKMNGHEAGTAVTGQKLLPDGQRLIELRIDLTSGKKKIQVHTTSLFDPKGNPVRKALDLSTSDPKHSFLIATFDQEGAKLIIDEDSKRSTTKVPLTTTASRAETSGFWWLRDKPAPGAKEEHFVFNLNTKEWDSTEVVFKGDEAITLAGHKVNAHKITTTVEGKVTTSWLDDKGEPYRVESGTTIMERY